MRAPLPRRPRHRPPRRAGHTREALAALSATDFVNAVDPASLALIVPIVRRGLADRTTSIKVRHSYTCICCLSIHIPRRVSQASAAVIAGNMCSLIAEPRDILPYMSALLPALQVRAREPCRLSVLP